MTAWLGWVWRFRDGTYDCGAMDGDRVPLVYEDRRLCDGDHVELEGEPVRVLISEEKDLLEDEPEICICCGHKDEDHSALGFCRGGGGECRCNEFEPTGAP